MPKNINCITIIITFKGIEKIELKKKKQKTTKRSEEDFFLKRCKKTSRNAKMASWFYDYLILIFHWFISAG